MSHLSLRTNEKDEYHLEFLEKALGLSRSQAARVALSLAVDYISQKKPKKLLILKDSGFIGANDSKNIIRVNFRQKLKKQF
jgi:hypothetical protein